MKFVKVEHPELITRRSKNYIRDYLYEFYESDMESAEVIIQPEEYKSPSSCQASLRNCIRNCGLPLRCQVIHKRIYVFRTDTNQQKIEKFMNSYKESQK